MPQFIFGYGYCIELDQCIRENAAGYLNSFLSEEHALSAHISELQERQSTAFQHIVTGDFNDTATTLTEQVGFAMSRNKILDLFVVDYCSQAACRR